MIKIMRINVTVCVNTIYLLLATPVFFKILQHVTLSAQLSLSHLKWSNKAKLWAASNGLTTTADKAASSSCCSPSSSSKLTWKQCIRCLLYLRYFPRLPRCPLFWAPPCTLGTQVPLSLLVPKGNPSNPQIHSCHSPAGKALCKKQRFWEIHLARLSSTLSFSGGWHQALFVLRHITAVCHHLLLPPVDTFLVHDLKQTQSQLDPLWACWKYLKEMQIIPRKNYLPAWRAFGSNYKTKVKTRWIKV